MNRWLLLAWMAGWGTLSQAQPKLAPSPQINVRLTDAATGADVPFVSGYLKKGKNGSASDEHGRLSLTIRNGSDTLVLSQVGYETVFVPVTQTRIDTIRINLKAITGLLQEVTVTGYHDPGKALMRQIIAHTRTNDPQNRKAWLRETYGRMEVLIENLSASRAGKFMGNLQQVYQHYEHDTASTSSVPIFFREQYSREHHRHSPQSTASYVVAEQNLGLKTDELAGKLERFIIPFNIYDGVIPILKQSFVGPVSDLGLAYYAFSPPDTLIDNGMNTYRLRFHPKRKHENTFEGTLLIDADSYAIRQVDLATSPGVNMNFVQQLLIRQTFAPMTGADRETVWLMTENSLNFEFKNGLALLGIPTREDSTSRKIHLINTTSYAQYQIDPPGVTSANFFPTAPEQAAPKPFREEYRLRPLTMHEQAIYEAVDSLKNTPRFRRTTRMAAFIASGYWEVGNRWRFGPLSSIMSSSRIEGLRFRTSIWSMEGFDPNWCFWGYLAYGTHDRRFKEVFGVKYVPDRNRYRKYEVTFKNDYDALVEYDDQLDNDNLFTLALRKPIPAFQNFMRQVRLSHERDLSPNWSSKIYFHYGSLSPSFRFSYLPSRRVENPSDTSHRQLHVLTNSEIGVYFRYARNERTTILNYDKIRLNSRYPVWQFHVAGGVPVFRNTYFDYLKFSVSLSQNLPMPLKGTLYYNLTSGAVLGTVPLLLLHIPRGNPYFVADKYAFNGMSPYEFAADRYVSLITRYSLGGLILNKIPLLNQFDLRERVTANFFWGDLAQTCRNFNQVNSFKTTGRTPYAEVGVGVENIFNLFSVDCIWRLNHLTAVNTAHASHFGIYTGVRIQF
ncbi:DUF5686 family protein [Larkinella rosea]|uniref:Carboxypeptidase-like regulatory domain-containing protein n=1 Tax=Larkinella rosea TaxID=2025312 RepID=A0A3P1BUD9_9BACT|nr:DUF5686 family protein [Larkinella rosea]RRB04493.1 carboxypeptidase-like regulatory domain-containing protein [Larkinella rosea]